MFEDAAWFVDPQRDLLAVAVEIAGVAILDASEPALPELLRPRGRSI